MVPLKPPETPVRLSELSPIISQRPRFSLAMLLSCVTFVAVACGLVVRFGELGVLCVFGLSVVAVGAFSIRAKRTKHFWQCIGSFVILPYFLPSLSHSPPAESEAIIGAILHGLGTMLALSTILRGHWSTRILACVSLTAYLFILYLVVRHSIGHWDTVIRYWSF
jgi:hypothetical protein